MCLSGLVLDIYDDSSGSSLKSIYPTREGIPAIMKTAHVLTTEEHRALPDDVFALVLTDDSGILARKYACIDSGNTALSIAYFLQNKDKLPLDVQKVAAVNLLEACDWYELEPPQELAKTAGIGSVLGSMKGLIGPVISGGSTLSSIAGIGSDLKAGIQKAQQAKGIVDPNLIKAGEVSGTHLMPNQEVVGKGSPKYRTVIKKAEVGRLVQGKVKHPQDETPDRLEQNKPNSGKNPEPRQHRQLTPYVNIQGEQPPSPTTVKVSHYALRDTYPLDNYAQVKCAAAYFDEHWKHFAPNDRHEYCVNMVKQADALHIPVSDLARKYGSVTYAPAAEQAVMLQTRMALLPEEGQQLLSKLAAVVPVTDPEVFACALEEFDRQAGLHYHYDRDVADPFYSTFGCSKTAEYSFCVGNDYVNESQLKELAISSYALIKKRFGKDMADEFQKDPVGIFESMPLEQKKVISRLAADPQPTNGAS